MQIAITIALTIIGFVACYFLSFIIRGISISEMRQERLEYEQEYLKWQGFMEKAKRRQEEPDFQEEPIRFSERVKAFFTGTNLAPTIEELEAYEWDFLKTPLKEPEYSTWRRVLIGMTGAIAFGFAGYGYGVSSQLVLVLLLYLLLVFITYIDVDAQIIPPMFNLAVLILGIAAIWLFPQVFLIERFAGALCVSIPMLLIVLFVPGGFGGGDIKLMAAAGFLLGVKATVAAFMIGLILGGGYGIFALVTKRRGRKEHFAFGPCLCIGIAVAMYCDLGTRLVDLYLGSFAH